MSQLATVMVAMGWEEKLLNSNPTALIVSDDPMFRRGFCIVVENLGFGALEAAGVEQGRKCITNLRPEIVVVAEENLLDVLKDLPTNRTKDRPKVLYLAVEGSPHNTLSRGADIVRSRKDFLLADVQDIIGQLMKC